VRTRLAGSHPPARRRPWVGSPPVRENAIVAALTRSDIGSVISRLDGGTRAELIGRLQQTAGNQQVQRAMDGAPSLLQRQAVGERERTPTTGDLALVTGYLGRLVDNWHEGARQGCEEFWKWSMPKPGVGKDFWFSLVGNVIWAVGNTTTAGLVGIGIGAMQTYLSAAAAQAKAESAAKLYEELLTSINEARDAMNNERTLEAQARTALGDAAVLTAVRSGRPQDWEGRIRSMINPPEADSVNSVKQRTFVTLLKRYWEANVGEVEVVYAAYQPQPMGINIALQDWPEVAKLIREGDTQWHIYANKKIVGTQSGRRVEIPPDHPKRAEVESLVRSLERQALQVR
jgi:hypothetical protein